MKIACGLFAVLTVCPVWGYIGQTFTPPGGGSPVQILHPDFASLQMYVNNQIAPGYKSSLSGQTVFDSSSNPVGAIEAAMASWNNIGGSALSYGALQTTNAGAATDCRNVVTPALTNADLAMLLYVSPASPGALALTVSSFKSVPGTVCGGTSSVPSGSIFDSDILINPYFQFSTTPSSSTTDLQAAITHEFGHLIGLNHSSLLGTTMFPFILTGTTFQRHLSADERAFADNYYPGTSNMGTLTGKVQLGSSPAVYSLVTATDTSSGSNIIAMTDTGGNYSVRVPVGNYVVYAEPFNSFIDPTNIYSLDSQTTGVLNPSLATTAFQPTLAGGNANPTQFQVTAGSSAAANVTVTSGANALAVPVYAVGRAGVLGDLSIGPLGASGQIAGLYSANPFTAGTAVDLILVGAGIDSSVTLRAFGPGITVGAPRIDSTLGTFNGNPFVRYTLTFASRSAPALGSLWIVRGTDILSLSGFLDIEPNTPTITSVQDAASGSRSFVSGQYVAVYGSNLSSSTRLWNPSTDFTGGVAVGSPLPTNLDGVSVTIGGQPASIYFVSLGQINAIAPSNLPTGSVRIVATNQGSVSATTTATVVNSAPSFFYYPVGSSLYASAVRFSNGALVGDPSVFAGTQKALPGDILLIFGNGLAASPGDVIVSGTTLLDGVTVRAGNNPLSVLYAALVYAGEWQIAVQLPNNIPSGVYPLSLTTPGGGATVTNATTVLLVVGP